MEASEADDRDEEEASHTHDGHTGLLRPMAKGKNTGQVPGDEQLLLPPNLGTPRQSPTTLHLSFPCGMCPRPTLSLRSSQGYVMAVWAAPSPSAWFST